MCRGGQLPSRDANLHAISLGGHECLGAGHSSGVGSSVDDDAQGWFNKKSFFWDLVRLQKLGYGAPITMVKSSITRTALPGRPCLCFLERHLF